MNKLLLLLFIFFNTSCYCSDKKDFVSNAKEFSSEDRVIFNDYCKYIKEYSTSTFDNILEKTALFFLDKPYVEKTLETNGDEHLVVNLREFDCFTFVENVISLSRMVFYDNMSESNFLKELKNIRYRDGKIDDYTSRLHYTSDWIYNNSLSGIFKNISADLGGIKSNKKIDFMSTHSQLYPKLNNLLIPKIVKVEENISKIGFYYVPKDKIKDIASKIPSMSIIGFVTNIDGLDFSHVAFAYKTNNDTYFIHASSTQKKVVISSKTLTDYCSDRKSCHGISILYYK